MDGEITNYFPDNIGQHAAVEHANGIIHKELYSPTPSYKKPVVYTGEAGMGKTSFVSKFHSTIQEATNSEWTMVELNPDESVRDFLARWKAGVVTGRKVMTFTDEVHTLPDNKKLAGIYKRLLETNRETKNIVVYHDGEEHHLAADPYNHIHLAASNEEIGDEALAGPAGRYRTVYMAPYVYDEIGRLVSLMGNRAGLNFSSDALEYLAKRVKGSGREIDALIEELGFCCKEKICIDDARRTCARTKRFPDGLDQKDVMALTLLGKRKDSSAGDLSATLREDEASTKKRLRILAGSLHCFSKGRGRFALSDDGKTYLTELARQQAESAKMKVATVKI